MAKLVQYELGNGAEVLFETSDEEFATRHGGVGRDGGGGRLGASFASVATAAHELLDSVRSHLADADEVKLDFGVKVGGDANWFFAKVHGESTIAVTVTWKKPAPAGKEAGGAQEA